MPIDRRQHKRSAMNYATRYSRVSSSDIKTLWGIIVDTCESGMCLLTTMPLKEGEKIEVRNEYYFSETAIVRWNDIGGVFYKSGINMVV